MEILHDLVTVIGEYGIYVTDESWEDLSAF